MQDTDTTAESSIGADDQALSTEAQPSSRRARPHYKGRRLATVYDAVAGRITNKQALMDCVNNKETMETDSQASSGLTKNNTRGIPLRPDEVLFRRQNAPMRFAEHDVYSAYERDLPCRRVLPDSDLLEAIHAYASHFYGAMHRAHFPHPADALRLHIDDRSMDETALLAFGILVEEAGREALGQRGDMVFTEPASSGDDVEPSQPDDQDLASTSWTQSGPKRRKLSRPDEEQSEN